ncbi:LAME_0G02894g1_1 [Lachancea meyersii CBS 8951]|uniref:GPI inositol-deacylase n=1 Tax=Lachancea meyersii CBS 8951 TaxID=1266667 RepID=A0A1G4K670_9SACH|nr:LAME_0G02894g1_1 [Lachancea meyersii CBS 8951]
MNSPTLLESSVETTTESPDTVESDESDLEHQGDAQHRDEEDKRQIKLASVGANEQNEEMVSLYDEEEDDYEGEDSSKASSKKPPPEDIDGSKVNKQNTSIFTFNLPFGGKSLIPISPLSSLRKTLLPASSSDNAHTKSRRKIKLKLQRQETISSVEELELFQNQKGIDNVRARAVKRALKPGAFLSTIKSLSTDQQTTTLDGYSLGRIESIWDELEGDVVFLGGYRGSILRDCKTKRRIWLPIRAGLNIRKVDLLIGPEPDSEFEAQSKLYPDGMLTHFGPVDVCKKVIKKLRSNPKVNVEDFGYDWRLSLDIPARDLTKRLTEIYDKQDKKKGVILVAHSMGGLVAHKVLQEHTNLIRGIIYVGSPSQCPNILGPMRFGDEVIFNKTILSAEATFFMRSSFYFLPFDGRCFANKDTLERYDLDFFDPKIWRHYGLSPLVSEERLKAEDNVEMASPEKDKFSLIPNVDMMRSLSGSNDEPVHFVTPYNKCQEYLERTLKETREFLESLEYRENKIYPPLAIVYGNRIPTVRGAKVRGLEQIKSGEYEDFYYGPGDGVVHHKWLLPETRGFPVVAKIASECAHVSLMTDFEALAKAFISLIDNE